MLVGEALMKVKETGKLIAELLGGDEGAATDSDARQRPLLVKICGTRSAEAAATPVKSSADLIEMILVTATKRCVSTDVALQISKPFTTRLNLPRPILPQRRHRRMKTRHPHSWRIERNMIFSTC